jgi:hypothetical protein
MAMSVDSKPLISTLQQLSDQRFKGQVSRTAVPAVAITTERERLESAQQALNKLSETLTSDEKQDRNMTASRILAEVLRAFNKRGNTVDSTDVTGSLQDIEKPFKKPGP